MSPISRIILFGYILIFGRAVVRDKYIDRSRRMIRSALLEQEQALRGDSRQGIPTSFKRHVPWIERLSDRVCDILVQEAYHRASTTSRDGVVRWKGYLLALFEVAEITGQALDGTKVADQRITQILETNRVI
jgi:hypothetical protein